MSADSVSHQTIRLSKGNHASPADGACVMELASMLADEPFSDHPASVCPVIGALLRAYNDAVDAERRQDLYAFAAAAVGTNGSASASLRRAARLADWTAERRRRRGLFARLPKGLHRIGLSHLPPADQDGTLAVLAIGRHTSQTHTEVLALIRELLDIGAVDVVAPDVVADEVEASFRPDDDHRHLSHVAG